MGNHKAALPLYTRALEISEAVLGPRHPDTAGSLNNLAMLHKDMGNHKAALPLLRRALEISEAVLGPRHPTTEGIITNLVVLQKHLGTENEVDATGLPLANEKRDESGTVVTVDAVATADRARASLLAELELEELNAKAKKNKIDPKKKKKVR